MSILRPQAPAVELLRALGFERARTARLTYELPYPTSRRAVLAAVREARFRDAILVSHRLPRPLALIAPRAAS